MEGGALLEKTTDEAEWLELCPNRPFLLPFLLRLFVNSAPGPELVFAEASCRRDLSESDSGKEIWNPYSA